MKCLTVNILNDKWRVHVLSDAQFKSAGYAEVAGLTEPESFRIYLNKEYLTQHLIAHELSHAYFSYLCLDDADLNSDQMQEVTCEFVARYASTILKQSKELFRKL